MVRLLGLHIGSLKIQNKKGKGPRCLHDIIHGLCEGFKIKENEHYLHSLHVVRYSVTDRSCMQLPQVVLPAHRGTEWNSLQRHLTNRTTNNVLQVCQSYYLRRILSLNSRVFLSVDALQSYRSVHGPYGICTEEFRCVGTPMHAFNWPTSSASCVSKIMVCTKLYLCLISSGAEHYYFLQDLCRLLCLFL